MDKLIDPETPAEISDLGELTVSKLADFVSIIVVIAAAVVYFLTR